MQAKDGGWRGGGGKGKWMMRRGQSKMRGGEYERDNIIFDAVTKRRHHGEGWLVVEGSFSP